VSGVPIGNPVRPHIHPSPRSIRRPHGYRAGHSRGCGRVCLPTWNQVEDKRAASIRGHGVLDAPKGSARRPQDAP
jgi:hypothetical protein